MYTTFSTRLLYWELPLQVLRDTQKELLQIKEENQRLCRDLAENNAQKEDQEERIATLEKRFGRERHKILTYQLHFPSARRVQ